jgi:hypothetical protein
LEKKQLKMSAPTISEKSEKEGWPCAIESAKKAIYEYKNRQE